MTIRSLLEQHAQKIPDAVALRFYEDKLGLAAHFAGIREKAEEIGRLASSLADSADPAARDAAKQIGDDASSIVSIF